MTFSAGGETGLLQRRPDRRMTGLYVAGQTLIDEDSSRLATVRNAATMDFVIRARGSAHGQNAAARPVSSKFVIYLSSAGVKARAWRAHLSRSESGTKRYEKD